MTRKRGRPKKTCFTRLRDRMQAFSTSQAAMAERLGISRQAVSDRMMGACEWSHSEMYVVMDMLDIPYEQMYLYWPKDFVKAEPVPEQNVVNYLVETHQSLVSDSSFDALLALVAGMEKARTPRGRAPRAI